VWMPLLALFAPALSLLGDAAVTPCLVALALAGSGLLLVVSGSGGGLALLDSCFGCVVPRCLA
jgi:hypothetical protein